MDADDFQSTPNEFVAFKPSVPSRFLCDDPDRRGVLCGGIDRPALEAANLTVTATPQPGLVGDHGFTSGRIGQQSFEKLKSPSAMKLGLDHGVGCDPARFSNADRAKGTLPDQFDHEIATAFNLKGKGLIVLTSCDRSD